ncbi:hypothetical protein [Loktanella sp. M215]|uniref:hypothetical protein n=1 Tax=Loktanella sp. M215 TaxID=2675431 RepID=UPI001F440432|nr:hypothetical protein [Loktanella sp. M215]MCF7698265.1 hypothetical protein [Loktanella sp. M215]
MRRGVTFAVCALIGSAAAAQQFDYGISGMFGKANRTDLPPLTLSSGKPVAEAPYILKSGGYYRIEIEADGTMSSGLTGADFFHAVWVKSVEIDDIEIVATGLQSINLEEGDAEISFIAIQPGTYTLSIPGSTGDTQKAVFTIQ